VRDRAGRDVGLTPAGLGGAGSQAFIATTVVLMVLTPFLTAAGGAGARRAARRAPIPDEEVTGPALEGPRRENHVVVAGYGQAAGRVGRGSRRSASPFFVPHLPQAG